MHYLIINYAQMSCKLINIDRKLLHIDILFAEVNNNNNNHK